MAIVLVIQISFLSNHRNIILIFALVKTGFFCLCKIADNENSPDNYKALKIGIGAMIKNLEILRFIPDHFKTKKMCKKISKNVLKYCCS